MHSELIVNHREYCNIQNHEKKDAANIKIPVHIFLLLLLFFLRKLCFKQFRKDQEFQQRVKFQQSSAALFWIFTQNILQ